jgi:thioredoxin reductase (NADPH)
MSVERTEFDVIILGGGPAGLSAAMWCAELGLHAVVLEKKPELGGQLHWIHTPILNYPGQDFANGADFLMKLLAQLKSRDFQARTGVYIDSVDVCEKSVFLKDGTQLKAGALIIATGVRRRTLGVEGESDFAGRGILETGQIDREKLIGKRVMIVGGGDAAFENAANLSEYAERVFLLHRSSEFSARKEFVDKVLGNPRIEVIIDGIVKKLGGIDRLEIVDFVDAKSGVLKMLSVDAMLVRIGVIPNSELFQGKLELDRRYYIQVSNICETSVANFFAIGDVANPTGPTIVAAAGTGAVAAKAIRRAIIQSD